MIRIELKFKNAVLYNYLREQFPRTEKLWHGEIDLHKAAITIGISYTNLVNLLNLKRSPYSFNVRAKNADRDWKLNYTGERICNYINVSANELFPPAMYQIAFPAKLAMELPTERFLPMSAASKLLTASPDDVVSQADLNNAIGKLLYTLTPREEMAVKMRYGLNDGVECSLEKIGIELGVQRQRAQQIIDKAMKKLRHPSRLKTLSALTT